MKNSFFLAMLCLVAVSCGEVKKIDTLPETGFSSIFYSNDFVPVEKQTTSCGSEKFNAMEIIFNLHLFMESVQTNEDMNFNNLIHGLTLKDSKTISETFYGEKIDLLYTRRGVLQSMVEGQAVDLCPSEEYKKDTIESASLNTSFYVKKTNEYFLSVIKDVPLPPVELHITPVITESFIDKGTKISQYMTNNAFYSQNQIVILPHNKQWNDLTNVRIWEVPMVASHEYGHHIFASIYKNLEEQRNQNCFGTIKFQGKDDYLQRKVTIRDVLGAYNEGFADLIAYYSLSKKEIGLKGVMGLELTRDVESPLDLMGNPKSFSASVLSTFFSTSVELNQEVNYQDIHVIGAIFAYNANLFLSRLTLDKKAKLEALVEWVKYLNAEKLALSRLTPEKFLEETFAQFLKMNLRKFQKKLDRTICDETQSMYPDVLEAECQALAELTRQPFYL